MTQAPVSDQAYRLCFLHSRWPALIVDQATQQVLDTNLAWQAAFNLSEAVPFALSQALELEAPIQHLTRPHILRGALLTQPLSQACLCHLQPLNETLLWIECQPADEPPLRAEYEHLKKLNQRKSDLIANLSHELRTPLTSILGWPEILLDTQGMPGVVLEAAQAIRKDGVFLSQLLEDLIDLSKIEAGYLQLHLQNEDLTEIIFNAVEMLGEQARHKHLGLQADLPAEPVWVLVDAVRITQILLNYLSNAIKYTPKGGQIRLALQDTPETVIVSISDNGIGMSEQIRAKAFERFIRADEALSQDGAGIGLSLVKKLVTLHGGECWAESSAGQGSTFYFSLPRAAQTLTAETLSLSNTPHPPPWQNLAQTRLMIVAPEAEVSLLQQLLQPYFAAVLARSDLPLATELQSQQIQVLLLSTSLEIPEHSLWLASLPSELQLSVLALSSSAMQGDSARLLTMGYHGVIAKPFLKDDLLQYIEKILTGDSTDV